MLGVWPFTVVNSIGANFLKILFEWTKSCHSCTWMKLIVYWLIEINFEITIFKAHSFNNLKIPLLTHIQGCHFSVVHKLWRGFKIIWDWCMVILCKCLINIHLLILRTTIKEFQAALKLWFSNHLECVQAGMCFSEFYHNSNINNNSFSFSLFLFRFCPMSVIKYSFLDAKVYRFLLVTKIF